MSQSYILQCLQIIELSLDMLEQSRDAELVSNNLHFVNSIISQLSEEFLPVIVLIDRAITYIDTHVSVENQQQISNIGRPKIILPFQSLEYLLSLNFSVVSIASLYSVSVKTVHRRLKDSNLSIAQSYTNIDDNALDMKVADIARNHPNTGYKRMRGFLLDAGIKVTNQRVLDALRRVDPSGVDLRRSQNRAIYRRTYFVQHSMEIWHIDTHHKLIRLRYGIVVRGGIDGKSRTIVFLNVGANNTARSNFENFMEGVRTYGVPIRTRSDKGGENVEIARFMLETRGVGRGSHICGRSVHNQRIERLWRDVHYGCLSFYKCAFVQLEDMGYLNVDSPLHVAILQKVFIPRIRRSLKEFMAGWNRHAISSEHGRTPLQLMLLHLPTSATDLTYFPAPDNENILISSDEDLNQFELQRVEVENFEEILSTSQLERLNTMDMLRQSNFFGADLYVEAMELVSNI